MHRHQRAANFIQINHQNRSWAPEKLSNLLPPCSWGSAWLSNLLQWSLVIPNHRCCNTPSSTKASDQPIDLCVWRPNYNSSTSWRLNNTTESLEVGEVAEVVENVRLEVSNRSLYRGNGGCTREIISDGNPEPQLSGLPAFVWPIKNWVRFRSLARAGNWVCEAYMWNAYACVRNGASAVI